MPALLTLDETNALAERLRAPRSLANLDSLWGSMTEALMLQQAVILELQEREALRTTELEELKQSFTFSREEISEVIRLLRAKLANPHDTQRAERPSDGALRSNQ